MTRFMNADPEFTAAHPDLPRIEMRGMRNKTIDEYFDVDWALIWRRIRDDRPPLGRRIAALLGRVGDR
jgi:uncharacterized protein with HEPN domain